MNKTIRLRKLERNFISSSFPYKSPDRIVTGFRFEGMPPNQEAFTNNAGSHMEGGEHQALWKILSAINGVARQWTGAFRTADEAQAALEIELEREGVGAVM
jgi:hypothetical protein